MAEIASAFTCASLGVTPTVRHADYVDAWLEILRADARAIFRAASAASKAADTAGLRAGLAARLGVRGDEGFRDG